MSLSTSLKFDNSYFKDLEGLYVPWHGTQVPEPRVVAVNQNLATELCLNPDDLDTPEAAGVMSGSEMPAGAAPLAQAYAGHQFGGFAPQLGDGRALLIGEIFDCDGQRRDLHLKGSGRTPFSRGGDGKAPLGPVLREYLISEAMHGLGIPTSRALTVVTTGEEVMRDGFEPGAVLSRVASSHLRIGTFEFFAARRDTEKVRKLADYAIARHFSELENRSDKYLGLLEETMKRQAVLVAKWMSVGFIHGVMNTDNTAISGETIDYGPCAFMDSYDPRTVFSSIDVRGRYAYGNQPAIVHWNLSRFAETLLDLIDAKDRKNAARLAVNTLNRFANLYHSCWLDAFRAKLGLIDERDDDAPLIAGLQDAMRGQNVDFTLCFRYLAEAARGFEAPLQSLFDDATAINNWLPQWYERIDSSAVERALAADMMDQKNPVYIPRNHIVEASLAAASKEGDLSAFFELYEVLKNPFSRQEGKDYFSRPSLESDTGYMTFCGT